MLVKRMINKICLKLIIEYKAVDEFDVYYFNKKKN